MTTLTFIDTDTDLSALLVKNPEVILSIHSGKGKDSKIKVTNDPTAVDNFERIAERFFKNGSIERFTALEYGTTNPYIYYSFNTSKRDCIKTVVAFLVKSNWIKSIGGLTQSESSDTSLGKKVYNYFD